jgi:hypothetical protein
VLAHQILGAELRGEMGIARPRRGHSSTYNSQDAPHLTPHSTDGLLRLLSSTLSSAYYQMPGEENCAGDCAGIVYSPGAVRRLESVCTGPRPA